MYPDGVCRVTDSYYTKTVQFQDINYQLNQNEDKTAIFDGWCDFLNYFDSSIRFQLSFINLSATRDTYARRIAIPLQGDCFDKLRSEYTGMLQSQLARGNNGLIKTKYLTFGVEADSLKAAKPRLERIETDILNNFRRLGVQAEALNGMERLRLLHGMLHMDEPQPFRFSWDWLAPSGLSVKDFIAPSAFEFKTGSSFGVGSKTGCVSFLQILAPELNDRMLADFLDMESSLIVSMHVQSVDQVKAIKTIKRKITDLQKMTIEEQKKAVRSGYDMDIIPSDLATYGTEAKKLLQELQSRNERMFLLTFLVVNVADNRQRLGNNVFQAGSIAQKYNCQLTRLDFQQEEGFMSALPLGYNQIEIQRGLTTSSVAIFVPFTTQELFQDGKEALYCGLNALSNNLIMVDRKLLKNPNGLILGTPGKDAYFGGLVQRASQAGRKGSAVYRHGAGNLRHRLTQRVQPPQQREYRKPRGQLRYQGAGQAAQKDRDAGGAGRGVEPRHDQPGTAQVHPLLYRRNAPSFEGGTDRRVYGGDMEAIPQVGRRSHGHHPERQRPALQP